MVCGGINGVSASVVAIKFQDPSQQPRNVYYIHPFDGPSSVYVKPLLTHSNYHAWARSMRRACGGNNKFDFVNGSGPIPESLIQFSKLGVIAIC